MAKVQVKKNQHNETIVSIKEKDGLTAQQLYDMLGKYIQQAPQNGDTPVCLCLQNVESGETQIVAAKNEGDNSHLWLWLDKGTEKWIQKGLQPLLV
jgi:hypothetical protein